MAGSMGDYVSNNINLSSFQSEATKFKSLQDNLVDKTDKSDEKLKQASQDFEAIFINQLLQVMDKTIERSDFMHGGQGEKVFREMFYQEISKSIASNPTSNFGLGQQVYEQLSQYE
ncbi:MAG: rod-binding protein [Vampirovibrionia bacterium]